MEKARAGQRSHPRFHWGAARRCARSVDGKTRLQASLNRLRNTASGRRLPRSASPRHDLRAQAPCHFPRHPRDLHSWPPLCCVPKPPTLRGLAPLARPSPSARWPGSVPLRVGARHHPARQDRNRRSARRLAKFPALRSVHRTDRLSFPAGWSWEKWPTLAKLSEHDISSLRQDACPRAKALPKARFEAWQAATGIKILYGIA